MMDTPSFDPEGLVRPALKSIALYLSIIVILVMAAVKPAHADGQVGPINVYTINSGGFNNGCFGKASVAEAMQCEVDFTNSYLDADYAQIASWGGYDIAICPRAVAHDLNTSNPNLYFFKVSPIYGLFAYMPPNPKIAVCTGGGEISSSIIVTPSSCPSYTNAGFPCTCKTGYKPDPTQTSCVLPACPAHASGTPCACDVGYEFDASGTSCVSTCPVDPLPQPPFPASDTCSNSLEQGAGVDVNNACATELTPDMQAGAQCVADKIHALAIPYTGPSATVRTAAYQNHLLDVWNKSKEIKNKKLSDAQKQACAAVIVNVDSEMARHGIDSPPSSSGNVAPHVLGRAIDIPMDVVNAMMAQVTNTTVVIPVNCFLFCMTIPVYIGDVQDYVNSATVNPPACNLNWGGRFIPYDPVHYQLP